MSAALCHFSCGVSKSSAGIHRTNTFSLGAELGNLIDLHAVVKDIMLPDSGISWPMTHGLWWLEEL